MPPALFDALPSRRVTRTPEETVAWGEEIGRALRRPPAVVALRGGLGAGKTCLTRGIAAGAGVTEAVLSPSYTIVAEYEAALPTGTYPFYHIDAWRLAGVDDFYALGGEELLADGIAVIEWSERLEGVLPADALIITITIQPDGSREFTTAAPSAAAKAAASPA